MKPLKTISGLMLLQFLAAWLLSAFANTYGYGKNAGVAQGLEHIEISIESLQKYVYSQDEQIGDLEKSLANRCAEVQQLQGIVGNLNERLEKLEPNGGLP
ncbi:MAG TPA: hypothetical protein VG125_19655 [Pirellulales bacterium]|jgi:ubiquinone biosynthesis protein UbiJ|nr:hypothetical protein [Pirellulales bacterium]